MLIQSLRGQYIIGQALYLALESMQTRPDIEREPSNEADMKLLMEEIFPIYHAVATGRQAMNESGQTKDV
tara:strand:+ start:342 stop:551 length:210 start_codon:yes stop_codon:yes gene_type:complete